MKWRFIIIAIAACWSWEDDDDSNLPPSAVIGGVEDWRMNDLLLLLDGSKGKSLNALLFVHFLLCVSVCVCVMEWTPPTEVMDC